MRSSSPQRPALPLLRTRDRQAAVFGYCRQTAASTRRGEQVGSRAARRWALLGLSVHLLLVSMFLVRAGGNPQYFVHFGVEASYAPFARQVLGDPLLTPHSDGHDGQAFWLLARDPLLLHGGDVLVRFLDRPAYRAQRIFYPLLASPWRLAGETGLLWGLLATNLALVFGGGLVACSLAEASGAPSRAGLAFSLSPGVLGATIFSLSDTLALALLLGTMLALLQGRRTVAVACAVLGVLTKESTIIGLVGLAALAPRVPLRTRVLLLLVPASAASGWALYARWRLGWPPSQLEEFAVPFCGYLDAWRRGWSPVGNWFDAVLAFALLPLALLGILRWRSRRSLFMAGAVPFFSLVPFLSAQVLDLAGNSLRVMTPAITLLVLDYYAGLGGDRA